MHCGCPLPGDTVGKRLKNLVRHLKAKSSASSSSASVDYRLVPPHRPDALSATHASEHNSVQLAGNEDATEANRVVRVNEARRRRERDQERVGRGEMDGEVWRRGFAHEAAFLYPVPLESRAPPVAVTRGVVPMAGTDVGVTAAERAATAAMAQTAAAMGMASSAGGCVAVNASQCAGGGGGGGVGAVGGCVTVSHRFDFLSCMSLS